VIIKNVKRLLLFTLTLSFFSLSSAESNEAVVCFHSGALYYVKNSGETALLRENLRYAYPTSGESYRADNGMALLKKYGKSFDPKGLPILDDDPYKVLFTTAKLVPEPTNKFDKFAIKVVVKGKHVSYIPSVVSYDVASMMKKTKQKSLSVKACISHYPGGYGPQVSIDLDERFLGEGFDQVFRMEVWREYNDLVEQGPGVRCTKYFSKFYCGPLEK
jgi:hypothetical protein